MSTMPSSATGHATLPRGVSIVVPVYNSERTLGPLVERAGQTLERLGLEYEVILVNDASRDQSWSVISDLAARDPRVIGLEFVRNFGQHNALLCGIRAARFATIATLDDDLQHPPEQLPVLLAKLEEGYDVVYGAPELMRHSLFRNLLSRATKLALARAMGVSSIVDINAFRVFRTDVRRAFEGFRSPNPMIDVLLSWGTVRFASVSVPHEVRRHGRSNYTIGMLFNQAMLLLTGFSTGPLRAASILGFGFTLFGIAVFVYVIAVYFLVGSVPGFPFLAAIIALFSGAQMFALGIMGEYLARMFNRTMERPGYVVGREAGEVQRTGARWVDAPSGDLPHALRATAVRGAAGRE
jgi:glycosyltransferase involved in cell wall biosynthesis